jgi:hypothetical protein
MESGAGITRRAKSIGAGMKFGGSGREIQAPAGDMLLGLKIDKSFGNAVRALKFGRDQVGVEGWSWFAVFWR